jgi:pyruvate dehydrogenase E1 component
LENEEGVFVSASDYVRALAEQLRPWIPGDYHVLGCDGMGRSETRETLRRHFEVDADYITLAALHGLRKRGEMTAKAVAKAIKDLGIDPEKPAPLNA